MNKSSLTVVVGVLLVLVALFNFGVGFVQYGKAELLQGTTNALSGMGEDLADFNKNNPFARNNDSLRSSSRDLRRSGTVESSKLYLIAFFILGTAVLQIAASIGLFGGKSWAIKMAVTAAICGILVEFQDLAEDGFSAGQMIFILIYGLVLYTTFTARQSIDIAGSLIRNDPEPTTDTITTGVIQAEASTEVGAIHPAIADSEKLIDPEFNSVLSTKVFCIECGKPQNHEANFCTHCGFRLET